MEDKFQYWFWLLIISYLLLIFVLKFTVHLWWRPRRIEKHFSKQGIKGPPYHFFIGNIKELVGLALKASSQPMPLCHNILPRVLSFYHHWRKIYGATFLVWFGPTARLTISDPVLIKEIFILKSEFFEKNESPPLVRKLEGDGLLTLKGEKWAHHRKIITPTFHIENLKLMIPTMGKSTAKMLDRWFLPTKENRISWRLDKEVRKSLMKLIDQRIKNYDNQGSVEECPNDLLEIMIKASLKETNQPFPNNFNSSSSSSNITVHDIVEECKTIFFAGKHTTSNLLTWTTILLAMHPQWQELARDEVLKVCGSRDNIPSKDDVAKLKTLGTDLE
ncbi:hypothetical protein F0562_023026 [Nyssa sinensis]|uniref:Cytochrome P450 n=1 Tax=Nyssa sinensis TaxID=561372 RepID=A0A5J5BGS6_9ASTE|nr:hypothetical protein F0562_023026 [Nyssa sinensis]